MGDSPLPDQYQYSDPTQFPPAAQYQHPQPPPLPQPQQLQQQQQQQNPYPPQQQQLPSPMFENNYRPQTSQSDSYATGPFSPPIDADPNARYPSPNMALQYPPSQQQSRPASGMSQSYDQQSNRNSSHNQASKNAVVVKVGMVGDAQIGKTSLMVKYVEGGWDEDYIQTLGVNFMEKTISIRNTEITFSIWDLGGQREFVNMLPLVCNDAVAILFMFDLTRKSTLNSIKEWFRQGRGFNKNAIPLLVGTKYDHFVNFPREDQEEISRQVGARP